MSSRGTVRQRHTTKCPKGLDGKGWVDHKCRGRWWWVLDLGPDPMTGKRRQPSKSGFATKRDAEADLAAARDRLGVTGGRSEALTTGDWLDKWLTSLHAKSPTTYARYEGIVRLHLKPHLGHVRLVELAPEHIDELLATVGAPDYVASGLDARHRKRATQQSSASVVRIFACLRRALTVAAKRRLIVWNPALAVEPPVEINAEGVAWTPEQAAFFLDGLDDDLFAPAWHLALLTGARRAEVCGAQWDLVDLDKGVWIINTTTVQVGGKIHQKEAKSQAGMRAVYLDAETVAILRAHRTRQAAALLETGRRPVHLFADAVGAAVKPDAFSRAWKKAVKAALLRQAPQAGVGRRAEAADALPSIKLHETRHTANTIARLYAKVDPAVLLQRMGHTEDTTNARYTHGHAGLHRQAAEDIAAVVRKYRRGGLALRKQNDTGA